MQFLMDVETLTVTDAAGKVIPEDQVPPAIRDVLAARKAEHEAEKARKAAEAAKVAAEAKAEAEAKE